MNMLLITTKVKNLIGEDEIFNLNWLHILLWYISDSLNVEILFYSSANKCLVKVAQYAAQLEQYEKAITIYEEVIY